MQRIMEEKDIANYLNLENFNDWRRTGYPALTPVIALSAIPRRMLYPESEILTNQQPQQSALLTDRVCDTNNSEPISISRSRLSQLILGQPLLCF